jgi:hypothetical protein
MVVNQASVDRFRWAPQPLADVYGIAPGRGAETTLTPRTVVGVARTSVYASLSESPEPIIYVPLAQYDYPLALSPFIEVSARTAPHVPDAVVTGLTAALTAMAPRARVTSRTLASHVRDSCRQEPLLASLSTVLPLGRLWLVWRVLRRGSTTSRARRPDRGRRRSRGRGPYSARATRRAGLHRHRVGDCHSFLVVSIGGAAFRCCARRPRQRNHRSADSARGRRNRRPRPGAARKSDRPSRRATRILATCKDSPSDCVHPSRAKAPWRCVRRRRVGFVPSHDSLRLSCDA